LGRSSPSPHSTSSAPGFAHAESDIGASFIMALDQHGITASNGGTALIAACCTAGHVYLDTVS
jgi:hypothetical protein